MKKFLRFLLIPVIISCSAASPYMSLTALLSSETVFSRSGDVSVSVPQNWFSAEDNETGLIELWLIEDNYRATLNLYRINLGTKNLKEIQTNGLPYIVQNLKAAKTAENGKNLKFTNENEYFSLFGRDYGSFGYSANGRNVQAVVFELNGKFYELSLYSSPGKSVTPQEWEQFRQIQKAILLSIK